MDFYRVRIQKLERIARITTIVLVVYLFCFGAAMAFFPIRPFWNDEWRLIYNIKFKDYGALWGRLDLLQECPRVYLSLLKFISAHLDYSYTSLRLPPLVIGAASVALLFYLRKRLYSDNSVLSYLFILILISSQTFTDYLTQVKQYEIDLFLCLVALWQLLVLLKVSQDGVRDRFGYGLACLVFIVAPFFSYTYPIVVAALYPAVLAAAWIRRPISGSVFKHYFFLLMPLFFAGISILVFYLIDVRHVMADKSMYDSYLKAYYQGERPGVIQNFWNLFALIGSGFLFELIFGVLGILAFFHGFFMLAKKQFRSFTSHDYFILYALALLLLVMGLVFSGKIVGGVARLTAYTVPSISILILSLLEQLKSRFGFVRLTKGIAFLLFAGLAGNIISSCINTFTYPEYQSRITTYRNTAKALRDARNKKLPFLYTDGVCGDQWEVPAPAPGKISRYNISPAQIAGADTVAAEVIVKVNPEYKVWDTIPIFYMPERKWINEYVKQLPDSFSAAIAGDGIRYKKYKR